jgi:hypothetical protein
MGTSPRETSRQTHAGFGEPLCNPSLEKGEYTYRSSTKASPSRRRAIGTLLETRSTEHPKPTSPGLNQGVSWTMLLGSNESQLILNAVGAYLYGFG